MALDEKQINDRISRCNRFVYNNEACTNVFKIGNILLILFVKNIESNQKYSQFSE